MNGSLRLSAPILALLLGACAVPQRLSQAPHEPERERRVHALTTWSFHGRIAVADGREAGSGRVSWQRDGDYYLLEVRAPVGGGTWRLSGSSGLAQLDGLHPEPRRDRDAEALLARELGWRLPVYAAQAWVRGLPADPRRARLHRDADGLPLRIEEAGWRIDYLAWFAPTAERPALPRRLVARRPPHEVRIAIADWRIEG